MARQRLGVVLLLPQPLATEVDGLRRALGDGALGRIPPHITLVPPVNVAERDLATALQVVRAAAAASRPMRLELGPVATFLPVNPVAYLMVGDDAAVEALDALRDACLTGPLERTTQHGFVPHVTVADDLASERLDVAPRTLAGFRAEVEVDRVHVLAEQPGRIWASIADAPLGAAPATVGRGSLPLELSVTGRPDVEAAALLAIEGAPGGLPFAVTARRDGVVVAAAWGWSGGERLEVADLVVAAAHRGEGIGRHVLATVEALAARRACAVAGIGAPSTGAPAALLSGCGWRLVPSSEAADAEVRRWERRISLPGDDA